MENQTAIVRITKYLPIAERVLVTVILVGIIIYLLQGSYILLAWPLLGIAVVFFLYSYRPIDIVRSEDEKLGFTELVGYIMLPKIMWIGSSVGTFGIAFYLFNFGNDGYRQILSIGSSCLILASLLLLLFSIANGKYLKAFGHILLRLVPVLFASIYILSNRIH